ncbi:PRKR-interacting protein 1 [Desmophyllum pertusum]|uniref:PRKR-interacting protein 1 n=1 Tax=Desmophyllum pertusum TaxID=174260 RepID=A0A9X0CEJ0_9CNID|nr:PRKR-interacting protein 1 [Desmophyllum pertusum]
MADESDQKETKKKPSEKPTVPRSATEVQKLKLEKLMKDPDKTVSIPNLPKQWKPSEAPEFIRFVMGSSAGAGSGEFHVYRATRRREYNRVAFIEKTTKQHELDESYHKKLGENKSQAEEKTAKKRAKGGDDQRQVDSSDDDDDDEAQEDEEPHFVVGGK